MSLIKRINCVKYIRHFVLKIIKFKILYFICIQHFKLLFTLKIKKKVPLCNKKLFCLFRKQKLCIFFRTNRKCGSSQSIKHKMSLHLSDMHILFIKCLFSELLSESLSSENSTYDNLIK